MKQTYILFFLFIGLILGSCTGKEELVEFPKPDPYSIDITVQSIGAGNIGFWFDGEYVGNGEAKRITNYYGTFLKSKGERKLELRKVSATRADDDIIHTFILNVNGENTDKVTYFGEGNSVPNTTYYWAGGESITDDMNDLTQGFPKPTPGHYGYILQLDTIEIEGVDQSEPVDIEMYLADDWEASFTLNGGEPVHVVENYTFGTPMDYFELPEELIASMGDYDSFFFRLCKAGTEEPYYPNWAAGYPFGEWINRMDTEYWIEARAIKLNLNLDKTCMITLPQYSQLIRTRDEAYPLLSPFGTPTIIAWDSSGTVLVGE